MSRRPPGPSLAELRADRDQTWRVAILVGLATAIVLLFFVVGTFVVARRTQATINRNSAARQAQIEEQGREALSQHQQIVDATQCLVELPHPPCRTQIVTITVASPTPVPVPTPVPSPVRILVPTPVPTVLRVPTPVPTPVPTCQTIKVLCR